MKAAGSRLAGIPRWMLVVLVAVAAQAPIFNRSLVSLDEGQLTAIGVRLLGGEILYRDIYTGIFPGIYWLAAALFAVFGTDVIVLRTAQVAVNALTAGALYVLVEPMVPGLLAWSVPLGYLALIALSFPVLTMLTYSSLALLAALGALIAARRFLVTARPGCGVLAGVLLGLCVIFKQNYGALALLSTALSALLTRREGALADQSPWFALAWPTAAGLTVALLTGTVLAATGAWPAFVESTFLTIFHSQMQAFDQPLPPVLGAHPTGDGLFLFLYSPGGLFGAMLHGQTWARPWLLSLATRIGYGSAYVAIASIPFVAWHFASGKNATERVAARMFLPFAGLFFLGIFPSAIWSHLAAVYPPLLVVLAALVAATWPTLRSYGRVLSTVAGAAGCVAAFGIAAVAAGVSIDVRSSYGEKTRLPSASVLVSRRDAALYQAADEFLRGCAAAGAPILVVPDMPLLYVTSGHRNPTPYDLIIPGDVRDDVIVERMDRARVDCVVFDPAMYAQFAPFEQLFPHLHAYMTEHFETARSMTVEGTTWQFLTRRKVST